MGWCDANFKTVQKFERTTIWVSNVPPFPWNERTLKTLTLPNLQDQCSNMQNNQAVQKTMTSETACYEKMIFKATQSKSGPIGVSLFLFESCFPLLKMR